MKILVLGSGAKDSAITWWFSRSRLTEGLYIAPGNPGTNELAVSLPDVDPADGEQVLQACRKYGIDFVFIGTEAPLITGVVDCLNRNGISTFGAPGYALKIEGDRRFSREFAGRHGIPMPNYELFERPKDLEAYLKKHKGQVFTIKPNSFSPSRVIINSSDTKTLMDYAKTHTANGPVMLEEHLEGMHVTLTILLDEKGYLVLPICSEYTKREHEDENVVTGGMGAICPVPLSDSLEKSIFEKIISPTLKGLKEENLAYKGVLSFSVVVADGGEPFLVDYHVRLNDPATQAFVPLVKNDLVELMEAMLDNTLGSVKLLTSKKSSVAVVIASGGYPQNTRTGEVLDPVSPQFLGNSLDSFPYLFFGAVKEEDGVIRTTGGRAATVVGVADSITEANSNAYGAVRAVTFNGCWYREDIGNKFFQ